MLLSKNYFSVQKRGTFSPHGVHHSRNAPSFTALASKIVTRQVSVPDLLAQKAGELAALCQPGRPAPKSSQVASLRKEIVALQSRIVAPAPSVPLEAAVQSVPPSFMLSDSPSPGRAASALLAAEDRLSLMANGSMSSNSAKGEANRIRNALQLVEQRLAAEAGGARLDEAEEIAKLTLENENLQRIADNLAARKQALLKLIVQHGIKLNPPKKRRAAPRKKKAVVDANNNESTSSQLLPSEQIIKSKEQINVAA